MQIDIDFEVFKRLTSLRLAESDSYNAVLRRLLNLDVPREIDELIGFRDAWFNGVVFPHGTELRATYKGQTFTAKIDNGKWVDADGGIRSSPSEAAAKITSTNVNGWRFWFARRPGDMKWARLDSLKE